MEPMDWENIFAVARISASGLSAERLRMEVIANNLANAFSTRSLGGGPYRRKDVVFEAVLGQRLGRPQMEGVRVAGIEDDMSDFQRVYQPGHPDADNEGYVLYPNVILPLEMVNLLTASRAYEANLKVLQTFRQMMEQALILLRG
ncbi:MAG: flagellar basal body rod protein FlgC [Gemmatales bacterium]|nr:flagellar basal body rod protein FlgC [Gemmatales bacterium]MCS7160306.1 flagellar basal body rod protein FlgC [Gemmatales bacterium]MDW8175506.1 flagellar basal body rod protein FlgC [Gemmatales bacterium]MDW8222299.1 flagellar basal body rod protein FlgC [Gemmatales bacterium]